MEKKIVVVKNLRTDFTNEVAGSLRVKYQHNPLNRLGE
jgi:hypothetical protein